MADENTAGPAPAETVSAEEGSRLKAEGSSEEPQSRKFAIGRHGTDDFEHSEFFDCFTPEGAAAEWLDGYDDDPPDTILVQEIRECKPSDSLPWAQAMVSALEDFEPPYELWCDHDEALFDGLTTELTEELERQVAATLDQFLEEHPSAMQKTHWSVGKPVKIAASDLRPSTSDSSLCASVAPVENQESPGGPA